MITCVDSRRNGPCIFSTIAMSQQTDLVLIDQPDELKKLISRLRNLPYVALDTEFIRERTFYPQLCLVQLAHGRENACIDVLTIKDITPLLEYLADTHIVKVLHSARQDLELLYHLTGHVPGPVFDTQIAMGLLGHDPQLSYAGMIASLFDIELDKSLARADWARRPIDPALLRYAADDVQFLAEAYPKLEQALSERQRLPWLVQECETLTQPTLYRPDPESSWRRVRGAGNLDRQALAVLMNLAAWREDQAMSRDRPRQWILKDSSLVALARTRPERKDQLVEIRGLNETFLRRHADKLLKICRSARPADAPDVCENRRPDVVEQHAFDELRRIVKTRADELGINASLLAPRTEIKKLLRGDAECALLNGWRFEVIGRDLVQHRT